jgi:hypothetical protein
VERIMMDLSVTSDAGEAAWIFPTPSPATVALGDGGLFDELATLTAPRVVVEHRPGWPLEGTRAGAAPGAGVTLLSRQTLGPFEVASLAADDAGALAAWLDDNGYAFPDGMTAVTQPYIDQGWYYVAVRLTPAAAGEALTGQLDPLWITFETDEIVYIMRTSALVPNTFPLFLYVFAEHRVEKDDSFGYSEVVFADFVDPADLDPGSRLAQALPGRLFLTKFRETVDPALVGGDYTFTYAPADEAYHETITDVRYDDYSWMLWLAGLAACGMLGLGALIVGGLVLMLRRARTPA